MNTQGESRAEMLLAQKSIVVTAALILVAPDCRAEVPCLDVSGCGVYYYTLGAMIYEVRAVVLPCLL